MPNVVRGDRMTGLMAYLVGPGRANEHTEPHLVAGDAALMVWHDDDELGRDAAFAIARYLDRPRTTYDVEVAGGHVWHCSLSLRAEEGLQSDETWNAIAGDFVRAMGFDDNEGTKAPCRWVAVRHGVSSKGNDHIHLVVNLVREDGTKASVHNDFRRAQTAARALEVKHGLEHLESVRAERSTRGYHPAEREAQARARARAKYERVSRSDGAGAPSWTSLSAVDRQARITAEIRTGQPRSLLALKVRGCASASQDEAEFVRRMRRTGLLVRARFADGRTDVVAGYSVAERPQAGERPIWYGGGHLARDLSLPRLRDGWPDTPTGASDAAAEWNAAKRGRRVVSAGRETTEPDPEMWAKQHEELSVLVDRLRSVPVEDRDTWATVARQTAGAFAAWSHATEDTPGDLAAAAGALSLSAQTHRRTVRPDKVGTVAISGTAMLLASAARGGQGTVAEAAMIRQLLRLTQAVHSAAVASRQERLARLLVEDTRARLMRVREALPSLAPSGGRSTATASAPATRDLEPKAQAVLDRLNAGRTDTSMTASPLPADLEAARRRVTVQPGAVRGSER